MPLPTWRDTKMRIRSRLADSQQELSIKTREWASKEQVLGIQPRAVATRPRELLSMPISWDASADADNDMTGTYYYYYTTCIYDISDSLYTVIIFSYQ